MGAGWHRPMQRADCVLALGARVEVDVGGQAGVEPRPPRQEAGREVERDAVHELRQERPEARVAAGHEGQRCREVLAELPIRLPRGAAVRLLERERVDEDRAAVKELDVVGGGIAERHPAALRLLLGAKREERRVLELGEGPLVRVGDEPDLLRRNDRQRVVRLGREVQGRVLVADEDPLVHEDAGETGLVERRPVVSEGSIDLPIQPATRAEDEATRIPVRARVAFDHTGMVGAACPGASVLRMVRR